MDPSHVGSEGTQTRKGLRLKPRTVLLTLLILILTAGTSYWVFFQQHPSATTTTTTGGTNTTAMQVQTGFAFFLGPPFFHVAPGQGRNITAFVQRSKSFSGTIRVEVVNRPNWVAYVSATIGPERSNGTLYVIASKDAPKTEANLTVRASSLGAANQTTLLDIKVVDTYKVVEKYSSAVVYNTTKILHAPSLKALTSYANDTGILVFSAETPQLQGLDRGDVIIIPPKSTRLLKSGLMRTVLSVTHQGGGIVVQTYQASLYDEFQELSLNLAHIGGNATAQSGIAPAAYVPDDWYGEPYELFNTQYSAGPVDISNGEGDMFSATGTFVVSVIPGIHFTWFGGLDYIKIHLYFSADEQVSLTGKQDTTLSWYAPSLKQIFDESIPILGNFVWLDIQANIEGRASGPLAQNINMNIHQAFHYEVGPSYNTMDDCYPNPDPAERCGGWFLYNSYSAPTLSQTSNSVTAGSGSGAKVEIGPSLQVGVNGGLGCITSSLCFIGGSIWGSISADFYMQLNSLIPRQPPHPASWWVDWGMDAYVTLGVGFNVLYGLYSASYPIHTWALGNILGPNLLFEGTPVPPVVVIIYPPPGQTLNVGVGIQAPHLFSATAIDPQDGDLCTVPGANLVWKQAYEVVGGPLGGIIAAPTTIGKGCQFNAAFEQPGLYHITFTATDAEGLSATSQQCSCPPHTANPTCTSSFPH